MLDSSHPKNSLKMVFPSQVDIYLTITGLTDNVKTKTTDSLLIHVHQGTFHSAFESSNAFSITFQRCQICIVIRPVIVITCLTAIYAKFARCQSA